MVMKVNAVLNFKSRNRKFESRSDNQLDLFQVVSGSTPPLHLYVTNWSASRLLGSLMCCYCIIDSEKPQGDVPIKYVYMHVSHHWLPVIYHVQLKLSLLVYKALNNQAPA